MGVLGKYGGNALKYFNSILASAYQNLSTADMWTAIHRTQETYGLPKPGASAPDVSVIRGYANRIANGARTLAAADDSSVITPDMMAVAPYTTRDLNSITTTPTYQVGFINTIELPNGNVIEKWQTTFFSATDFPSTVGEFRASIDLTGVELAAQGSDSSTTTPKGKSLGTSNHEIRLVLPDERRGALPAVQ